MQWDFWTRNPESAHQVTWLMGDRGLPRTWRNMDGFGSHTYTWVNAAGERFWVKYHFKTDQGVEFLTKSEARTIRGDDPDFHLHDLYNAIERGDAPSWTLSVQVMPYADAHDYRFNLLARRGQEPRRQGGHPGRCRVGAPAGNGGHPGAGVPAVSCALWSHGSIHIIA